MRLEATIPDSRGSAVQELADQLGLSRSQIIDEALTLFLKAVLETRRGRRLMTMDPDDQGSACEFVTPTLATLEWALQPQRLALPDAALTKMRELPGAAAKPGPRLRTAAKRRSK